MADREFDVVVFGATGVTGAYVVEELYKQVSQNEPDLKWAVAGRSAGKIASTLESVSKNLNLADNPLKDIPVIIADVKDENSLDTMAKRTKLVLNTVGPYRFFGEQVVKACVSNGTHHLDVSGEPQYLEQMQIKYYKDAEEKGIFVIGACGFDSIPAEMGLTYLKNNFDGDLNDAETYLFMKTGPKGMKVNFATWQSAIYGLAHASELVDLRRAAREKLFTKSLPPHTYKLKRRNALFWSDVVRGWCLPFLGSDRSVLLHSEMFRHQFLEEKPVQVQTYIKMPNVFAGIGLILLGVMFGVMSYFKIGRYLLEKFPAIFSFGMFSHGGPTREQALGCSFEMTVKGKGWSEKLSETTDKHSAPPNKTVVVQLKGPDPAYITTAICLVQASLVILREKSKLKFKGGVLSPGAVLRDSSYVDRLQKNGFTFQVLS